MKQFTIRKFDDMHVHLRQGAMLANVLPHTMSQCGKALVMPNTAPAIATAEDVVQYERSIREIVQRINPHSSFRPLMTFKILPTTTPAQVLALKGVGTVAGKLYPEGVTTNSEDGVRDFNALRDVYAAMEENNLVLCLHGEAPGAFCLDREKLFLETLERIASDFPRLRIVLEHATTADAITCVRQLTGNVAATITVHHLYITLDDVIGDKLNPHLFCKPIAKRDADREALREAATSGNSKFFLGTDSAPHPVETKECSCGAAGVYTAPVLMPALAQLFEDLNCFDKLESFAARFGSEFYGLPLNTETVTLVEDAWSVPKQMDGVVPFMFGETLRWRLSAQEQTHHEDRTVVATG